VGCSSDVPIAINNQSGKALRNVTISGSGFRQQIPFISAGQTITLYVDPRGESGVAIAFDMGQQRFSYPADGYFESDEYDVVISVDAKGKASVHTDLASLFTRLVGRW
jgi:hypothetical protein